MYVDEKPEFHDKMTQIPIGGLTTCCPDVGSVIGFQR